jgi:hypothetical protein
VPSDFLTVHHQSDIPLEGKMKAPILAPLAIALWLSAGTASASSIGVFFAADGSDCDATVEAYTPLTWYVCAVLSGDAAADGVTGAEFSLEGAPDDMFKNVFVNEAANVSLGSPVAGGCNIAFPTCQTGENGILLLYRIEAITISKPGPTYLTITKHTKPSNSEFQCPVLVLCDNNYTMMCVAGGSAIINGAACTVGVERTTWSRIKGLYH